MKKLYLHIGSNKTASTSIQALCQINRGKLKKAKLLYPLNGVSKVGAHHLLAGHIRHNVPDFFKPSEPFEDLLKRLKRELKKAGNVLISSEMLFPFSNLDEDALAQLCGLFDRVIVVVYLRRQDRYLRSFYNSTLRNGRTSEPFAEFCVNHRADYLKNLNQWAAFVGKDNLRVRPFDKEYWYAGDIYADFFATIDCDYEMLQLAPITPKNAPIDIDSIRNSSLPERTLEFLAHSNSVPIENRREFLEQIISFFETEKVSSDILSAPIYETIRDRYEASNSLLAHQYFKEEEQEALLFDRVKVSTEDAVTSLSREELMDLAIHIWNEKGSSRSGLLGRSLALSRSIYAKLNPSKSR